MGIVITDDINTEMMKIEVEETGECLFLGNYWDFDRSPNGLKDLLEELGVSVAVIEGDFNNW